MHEISVTVSAFSKEARKKAFDDFFSLIDSQLEEAHGYLTLSFKIATWSHHRKHDEESHIE